MRRSIEERFWSFVDKTGNCWTWTGGRGARGYGLLRVSTPHRRQVYAHRLSYEMHHGPIPEGMFVCHSCDNPPCVNPAHLFAGTHKENMADMQAKGRALLGERARAARLTAEAIPDIRRSAARGERLSLIASRYGVHRRTIWDVVNGATWKHVPDNLKG